MKKNNTNSKIQYLFFILNDEKYAIKASCVKEIVDFTSITKVPKAKAYIKGLTNIRGDLIAVIDLKPRLKIEKTNIKKRDSFIIVNAINTKKNSIVPIALMVDMVIEVEDIEKDNILEAPEFGVKLEQRFIENIISFKGDYISVLNMDEVLNIEELSQVN